MKEISGHRQFEGENAIILLNWPEYIAKVVVSTKKLVYDNKEAASS